MPTKPKQKSDVGERLRALRKSRNVTAVQLSKDLAERGVELTRITISKIETGDRADVTLTEAVAISEYFDVPLEELTGRAVSSPIALVVARELAQAQLEVERLEEKLRNVILQSRMDGPLATEEYQCR